MGCFESQNPRATAHKREAASWSCDSSTPTAHSSPAPSSSACQAQNVADLEDRLRNEVAPAHAAEHNGINGYAFHAADYRVQVTPERTTAAGGTFLDLLTAPALTTAA